MKFKILSLIIFVVLLQEFDFTESAEQTSDDRVGKSRKRRSTESSSYFFYQEPQYPRDCKEVYESCVDQTESGIFLIQPDGAPEPFNVHCNNSIDGGGWTVFQRRIDGAVDFYREWDVYKTGFGFLQREFWLGNDKLSYITNQGDYELRIDLNNVNGISYFAKYDLFRISDETSKYRLIDLGTYLSESTANYDAMATHRNMSFSTYDRDNDRCSTCHCALSNHGAWWYDRCGDTYLNALYFAGPELTKSISWRDLPGDRFHVQYTEMKIRPLTII